MQQQDDVPATQSAGSTLEETFLTQLREAGEHGFQIQCLAPYRRSTLANARSKPRADVCWPDEKIVVEIEGGTWVRSKYTTGAGIAKTCRKHNYAVLDNWSLLRFTTDMIKSGEAVKITIELLKEKRHVTTR